MRGRILHTPYSSPERTDFILYSAQTHTHDDNDDGNNCPRGINTTNVWSVEIYRFGRNVYYMTIVGTVGTKPGQIVADRALEKKSSGICVSVTSRHDRGGSRANTARAQGGKSSNESNTNV